MLLWICCLNDILLFDYLCKISDINLIFLPLTSLSLVIFIILVALFILHERVILWCYVHAYKSFKVFFYVIPWWNRSPKFWDMIMRYITDVVKSSFFNKKWIFSFFYAVKHFQVNLFFYVTIWMQMFWQKTLWFTNLF